MDLPKKWHRSSTGKTLQALVARYGVLAERVEFYGGFPPQFFSTLRGLPGRPSPIGVFARRIAVGFSGAVQELTGECDGIEQLVYNQIKTAIEEDISVQPRFHG